MTQVFVIDNEQLLDEPLLEQIIRHKLSRVPIYSSHIHNIGNSNVMK